MMSLTPEQVALGKFLNMEGAGALKFALLRSYEACIEKLQTETKPAEIYRLQGKAEGIKDLIRYFSSMKNQVNGEFKLRESDKISSSLTEALKGLGGKEVFD